MNFNQLKYAIKLAELGNFTLAAENLYITQPTLSQQIKLLEEELGVELFNRKKRKVELTEAGTDFIYHARKIINELGQLNISIGNYSNLTKGELRIGLFWTFGYLNIADYINQFTQQYPLITIKVIIDGSVKLLELMDKKELDVVFIVGSNEALSNYPSFSFTQIADSEMAIVVHKQHPLATKKIITAKDLHHEKLLMVSKYSNIYPRFKHALDEEHSEPIIIGESSQTDISIQAASSGLCAAICSVHTASAFNDSNTVFIPFRPKITRDIYLVTPKDSKDLITKTFKESALQHFFTNNS